MSPPPAPRVAPLEVTSGWYGRACHGHAVSGDLAIIVEAVVQGSPSILRAILIDVAGHGPDAAAVTERLRGAPYLTTAADPTELATQLNAALRGVRGAAVAIVDLDREQHTARCVAIGSIYLRIEGTNSREIDSQSGVVGEYMPTVRPKVEPIDRGDVVLIASDGVSSRKLSDVPRAWLLAPAERLARRIVHEYGQPHDDATCIVLSVMR
jgi:serine phosphatase RsbU (regulator of sigma subunit)